MRWTESAGKACFAGAVPLYLSSGLGYPVPLPFGQKGPPPRGVTRRGASRPTEQRYRAWALAGESNLGLVPASGVVGLDIDAYDAKRGDRTMQLLEAESGPLPSTFMSSNRGRGVTGIRLYRVPPAQGRWRGQLSLRDGSELLGDVDVIAAGIRYMVAWPSVHPSGRPYYWYDPAGRSSMSHPRRRTWRACPRTAEGIELAQRGVFVFRARVQESLNSPSTDDADAWLEFATVYRRFAAVLPDSASALNAVRSGCLGGAQ